MREYNLGLGLCGMFFSIDGEAAYVATPFDGFDTESMKFGLFVDSNVECFECVGFNGLDLSPVKEDEEQALKDSMKAVIEIINLSGFSVYSIWHVKLVNDLGKLVSAFAIQTEADDSTFFIRPMTMQDTFKEPSIESICSVQPYEDTGEYEMEELVNFLCELD